MLVKRVVQERALNGTQMKQMPKIETCLYLIAIFTQEDQLVSFKSIYLYINLFL